MELQKIETDELLQMYANAWVTCGCDGHWKGHQNEILCERYALELRSRGIIVPKNLLERLDGDIDWNVEIPEGIFNGKGSY